MKKLGRLTVGVLLTTALTLTGAVTAGAATGKDGGASANREQKRALAPYERARVPFGVDMALVYDEIVQREFQTNVEYSNKWIRGQLSAYRRATKSYKRRLREMVNGGGPEGGFGMRTWLTDPGNVRFWDNAVRSAVGDQGYARVVAINQAFGFGSREYLLIYGDHRRYNQRTQILSLNKVRFRPLRSNQVLLRYPGTTDMDLQFAYQAKFGDPIRAQMLRFYNDFIAGKVSRSKVATFNGAYALAGGCAMAQTGPKTRAKAQRYWAAHNIMARALSRLGYPIEVPKDLEQFRQGG